LAIPTEAVQQTLREQILEELLSDEDTVQQIRDLGISPNQIEVETSWELWGGHDFSTSGEDQFIVSAEIVYYDSGAVRWYLGYLEVKFRLDPHRPGDEADFRCNDAVVSYPNVTLTHTEFGFGEIVIGCAGEGCISQSDRVERKRCKIQNNIQPALTGLSAALQLIWGVACAGEDRVECHELVDEVVASNDLRATVQAYLEDSYWGAPKPYVGYPSAMLLRLPSWNEAKENVESLNRAIVGARSDPQDPLHGDVVKYGVYVRCERGVGCADRDHDGYCDDEDCCPDRFAYDNDCTDLDLDGVADACDNCQPGDCTVLGLPIAACKNADQLDFDHDGKGNVCDLDSDDDGFLDPYDCDPYNPMLGLDTDQDGACERLNTGLDAQHTCMSACALVRDQIEDKYGVDLPLPHQWWKYLQDCLARCQQASDNCADGPVIYHVPACQTAHDLLVSGQGPATNPGAFAECRELFWNQDQEKRAGHLVGTRCETDVTNLTYEPERQAGERYTVQVQAASTLSTAIPFVLRLRPAALQPVAEIDHPLDVTSVVIAGSQAYLGHATFVTAVDLSRPEAPVVGAPVFTGGLVQELAVVTASTLAVVQTFSAHDLVVLDRAIPSAPTRIAGLRLPGGPCRSLALRDRIAYVACGASLHLVNLGQPSAPELLDTWHLGGLVTDVEVAGALLVVGQSSGKVRLYDLGAGSSPVQLAERSLGGKPVQAYLSGSRLFIAEAKGVGWGLCAAGIRCGFGSSIEVFSVDGPTGAVERLDTLGAEALRIPFLGLGAGVVVEPKIAGLRIYQAEVLP
jgi:hypothetical protein